MTFFAKKTLGQNFLKSEKALEQIVSAGNLSSTDIVVEAGPGQGALTEKLLTKAGKVIAVEKDDRLIPVLQDKFHKEIADGRLVLIPGDILDMEPGAWNMEQQKYKIVANIPYYITGQFFRKFLEGENQPETMVILIQKEVAERIVARDNRESILSISVKVYGNPEIVDTVKAGSFVPAPSVDSAIICIKNISKKLFIENNLNEQEFFKILHAGFAHKRKVLIKNLESIAKREDISRAFLKIGIKEKARAEEISPELWIKIAKILLNNTGTVQHY